MGDNFNFDIFQQIYCLSFLTGSVGGHEAPEATLQAILKEFLTETLPQLTGSWTLSWGPRVYKEIPESPEGGPDNVWFAAVDDIQKVCVVAIAGTASNSLADIHQDLDVSNVVEFNTWVKLWSPQGIPPPTCTTPNPGTSPQPPYCAKGTCDGVWNIVNNVSTEPGEGTRIDQYLRGLDSGYTVVFTGHSLGGALAPIVALGLVQANLTGNNDVKVLPSAGVSPGNDTLAAKYAAAFPKDPSAGTGYRVYNTDYYNVFDIIPQAWSIRPKDHDRNLNNILDNIVHCTGNFLPDAETFWNKAIGASYCSHITYTPLPGESFTGRTQPPPEVDDVSALSDYAGKAHVLDYWDELGIREFMEGSENRFRKGVKARVPSSA
ncbi:hypothetical protein F4823DRAFT_567633 [Ustulina deusta]|nr:hypothetical protein F4823DRAFT_567633 [Ustulina deusta]